MTLNAVVVYALRPVAGGVAFSDCRGRPESRHTGARSRARHRWGPV